MSDDTAFHQVDENRREPGLHDVAAEHHDHAALAARGAGDRVRYEQGNRAPTRTSGSARRNAANERSSPGGEENSSARTLLGVSRWERCGRGRDPFRPAAFFLPLNAFFQSAPGTAAPATERLVSLRSSEMNEKCVSIFKRMRRLVVGQPDLGVAVFREESAGLIVGWRTIAGKRPAGT